MDEELITEIAEQLQLVVYEESGPKVVPTSLEHRKAVVRETLEFDAFEKAADKYNNREGPWA